MSTLGGNKKLVLPDRMKGKLESFQRKIWLVKATEGVLAASFGLLFSYLLIFILDRFFDTSSTLRAAILVTGSLGLGLWFPLVCHKWIWRSRKLEQVARLLRFQFPRLSDHLLGIIELVNNPDYRGQSEQLCHAALKQVDQETKDKNFSSAVPFPKHRKWALAVAAPAVLVVLVAIFVPAAGRNAFSRWLMPWLEIERYTFAQVHQLPDKIVVPEVEPSQLQVRIKKESPWRPEKGQASIGPNSETVSLSEDQYNFSIPPQKSTSNFQVSLGDFRKSIVVDPKPRPELKELNAVVQLPEYLQRSHPQLKDARSGVIEVLEGASFQLKGVATRELQQATINGETIQTDGEKLLSKDYRLKESTKIELNWTDQLGLQPRKPMPVSARITEDESPMIQFTQRADNQSSYNGKRYLLETDVLVFDVQCEDDFGIKTIGMEWNAVSGSDGSEKQPKGEFVVAAGDPERTQHTVKATFSPRRLGIQSSLIILNLYTVDYFPGRGRVYGQPVQIFVLSQEEHAILLTKKFEKWFKRSLEAYESEQQLFQENVRLRDLPQEELDSPKVRKQIEAQAAAERTQAARLKQIASAGERLAKEATKNDQFNVATIEKLAKMLQSLKKISDERMPNISDLLKKAAKAKAGSLPSGSKPSVSNNKGSLDGGSSQQEAQKPKEQENKVPSIGMTESSMDQKKPGEKKAEKKEGAKPSASKFGLPTVSLKDNSEDKGGGSCPAKKQMEKAVDEQEDLLAEFQKVAEELQKILNNLEGSTFVKRLKALSRRQMELVQDINRAAVSNFGNPEKSVKSSTKKRYAMLAEREKGYKKNITHIKEDMEAYFNRVKDGKFQKVLKEIDQEDVPDQMNNLAGLITDNQPGSSISHSEFLADMFDRWAEQLVGPG